MASGEVTADPESLRFQYPLEDTPSVKAAGSKKIPPTVYREQDRFLPINNVSRVMRNAIPKTGKVCVISQFSEMENQLLSFFVAFQVSKDAKECMQECVSEFISFITSEYPAPSALPPPPPPSLPPSLPPPLPLFYIWP